MGRPTAEDPKLTEVKAILARLQRISPDDEAPFQPTATVSGVPQARANDISAAEVPAPAARLLPPANAAEPRRRHFGPGLLAAGVVVVAVIASRPLWRPSPASAPVAAAATAAVGASTTPSPSVTASEPGKDAPPVPAPRLGPSTAVPSKAAHNSLTDADTLIRSGKLAAGRAALLDISGGSSTDVAWALARSYDPNFVATITNADADADIEAAARWYRRWHDLAVAQGLVADSVSVDRIIRAMQK